MFWKYTLNDIRVKLRLYLGEKQSEAVQNYESLALIASEIFGGKKGTTPKGGLKVAQTEAEIMAGMKDIFGG